MNHDDTNDISTDREDASDLQQWIDGLLRSSDAAVLEAAPATTHAAATTAVQQLHRYRKRRQTLAVFASAAAIAAIAMWPNAPLPRREGTGERLATPLVSHASEAPETVENPSPSPSLQGRGMFVSSGDAIAVQLSSPAPEVTIVQLHPTTITQRRAETDLFLRQLLRTEPNGG
jgi:hypothetical protein